VEYAELRKLFAVRWIIRGTTPIDYGLSVAVAIVIAVAAWGSNGEGMAQPITVTASVQA
jgi:hypothetical protein